MENRTAHSHRHLSRLRRLCTLVSPGGRSRNGNAGRGTTSATTVVILPTTFPPATDVPLPNVSGLQGGPQPHGHGFPVWPEDTPYRLRASHYPHGRGRYAHRGGGGVSHQTVPVTLIVGALHEEDISFHAMSSPIYPILGLPWLMAHDPVIFLRQRDILHWSPQCLRRCIPARTHLPCRTTAAPTVPAALDLRIQAEYTEYSDVFSKAKAAQLPPPPPRIVCGTAQWTCFPTPCRPIARFTPYPFQRPRQWRTISGRPSRWDLSGCLRPPQPLVSSSWKTRMEDYGRV